MKRMVLAGFVGAVASCFASGPPESWECTPGTDEKPCPSGELCASIDGAPPHCYSRCEVSSSCPAGEGCVLERELCLPYSAGCASHGDCAAAEGFFCGDNSTCQRKLPLGSACGDAAACQSGFCHDGACCDGPCTGCQACAQNLTGVTSGTCANVTVSTDPHDFCATVCDDMGGCYDRSLSEACFGSMECLSGNCTDGVCCDTSCSGICQGCTATLTGQSTGTCSPVPTGSDPEGECSTSFGCDGANGCVSGAANGVVCGEPIQCASGFCVEGVCCDASCDAGCSSCRAAYTGGDEGACMPVPADEDPRGECTGLLSCDGAGACYPPWSGVRQLGTTTGDYAYGVATDASGNVYVVGYTFGGLDGNTNAGINDLFLVKYNSSGVKQWTRQLGTTLGDLANGVATDANGNVYVAGHTSGGLDGNTNAGATDLFLVKYNSSGVKQWTRQLGTTSSDSARAVATDASGNVYLAGYTDGGLDGNNNAGFSDVFVAKYDSAGVKQWTRQLGTASYDEAQGVATDASGNVYVAGYTSGGLDGNTNAGASDLFLVKYNSSGVKQWTRQLGTAAGDSAYDVSTDASGNVYVAGHTSGGLDGNTNAGGLDVFLARYNSLGAKQWTRQFGTAWDDFAYGVATDASGNICVAGDTLGGLDGATNAGAYDLFVVKYNSSAVKEWTRQFGTALVDHTYGVAADADGNFYVAGYTSGGLEGNTSAGSADLFVVKYNSSGIQQ